jgi:hypothetical protein
MWQSIVFQPAHLARSMMGAQVWKKAEPLDSSEKIEVNLSSEDQVISLPLTVDLVENVDQR